jgi:hypothetical protein
MNFRERTSIMKNHSIHSLSRLYSPPPILVYLIAAQTYGCPSLSAQGDGLLR